jgi:hypothetical protein
VINNDLKTPADLFLCSTKSRPLYRLTVSPPDEFGVIVPQVIWIPTSDGKSFPASCSARGTGGARSSSIFTVRGMLRMWTKRVELR